MTLFEREIEQLYQELRYIWMYPDSRIIDKFIYFDVPGDLFDWTNLISFTIPYGYKGVIKNLGYDYWYQEDFDKFQGRLLINKEPYLNYDNLQTSMGVREILTLTPGGELIIPLNSQDLVEFQVTKTTSGGSLGALASRIRGWMWLYGDNN